MNKDNWVAWPTEPGFYWFYGYINDAERAQAAGEELELRLVKAVQSRPNELVVHCWSEFIYRNTLGAFLRMEEPGTPERIWHT